MESAQAIESSLMVSSLMESALSESLRARVLLSASEMTISWENKDPDKNNRKNIPAPLLPGAIKPN